MRLLRPTGFSIRRAREHLPDAGEVYYSRHEPWDHGEPVRARWADLLREARGAVVVCPSRARSVGEANDLFLSAVLPMAMGSPLTRQTLLVVGCPSSVPAGHRFVFVCCGYSIC